jgi:hypothetical protein
MKENKINNLMHKIIKYRNNPIKLNSKNRINNKAKNLKKNKRLLSLKLLNKQI